MIKIMDGNHVWASGDARDFSESFLALVKRRGYRVTYFSGF